MEIIAIALAAWALFEMDDLKKEVERLKRKL